MFYSLSGLLPIPLGLHPCDLFMEISFQCKVLPAQDKRLPQNGHELSIDLGLHNLMTCYDSENGNTFILGRKYLGLERYFHKEIARVQAQWYGQQSGKGVKHPTTSKHIIRL